MWEHIRRAGAVAWALVGLTALLVIVGAVAWWLRVIWPPMILSGAIVFILNPVVSWIAREAHVRRSIATGLTYLGVVAFVVGIGFALSPLIGGQAQELQDEWPELQTQIEEQVDEWHEQSISDDWPIEVPSWEEAQDQLGSGRDKTDLGETINRVQEVGGKVFHVGLIVLLSPIIAFYLLVDVPHLRATAESLIPRRAKPEVMLVAHRLNSAVGGYFRGQLMVAAIVGVMVSIGLAVIGLPFWIIVGMIAGVFNMIPLVGPWIGAVPGVIIALTTSDDPMQAVWVVVIMATAQQIDNHFITPNVMRRAVHLHPAAVMMALLAGGTIAGFFGLLLAVPITAVAKILVSHLWRTWVLGEPLDEIAQQWAVEDAAPAVGVVERVGGHDDA